jgi:hypothetical protein
MAFWIILSSMSIETVNYGSIIMMMKNLAFCKFKYITCYIHDLDNI